MPVSISGVDAKQRQKDADDFAAGKTPPQQPETEPGTEPGEPATQPEENPEPGSVREGV